MQVLRQPSTFERFDLDGDGQLSPEEVLQMLVSLNYEVDDAYVHEVLKVFGTTDANNGFIDEAEFPALAKQLNIEDTLAALDTLDTLDGGDMNAALVQEIFRLSDLNQNALLNVNELKVLLDVCEVPGSDLRTARQMLLAYGKGGASGPVVDAVAFEKLWESLGVGTVAIERVLAGAPSQAAAATRLQSSWRGKSARSEASVKKQHVKAGRASHKSEAGAALYEKLCELELDEWQERLRKIGVKRVGDLAVLSDEDLQGIGMNKFDRAALLSVQADMQMSTLSARMNGSMHWSTNSAFIDGGFQVPDVARERWASDATQLFAQFSGGEGGQLTREGWAAMSRVQRP